MLFMGCSAEFQPAMPGISVGHSSGRNSTRKAEQGSVAIAIREDWHFANSAGTFSSWRAILVGLFA
jgi:hypothetical protein